MIDTRQELDAGQEDLAASVARVVASAVFDDIAPSDVEAASKLTLDALGAGVAGHGEPGCIELLGLMTEFGGSPQVSVIGTTQKLPAPAAVAVNGTMCRALELDDVSEQALIHTTASVVPAALAAAEYSARPVDGRQLLTAISVGVDVANRLSLAPNHAMDGPNYRPRGMSYTYQIGTFAAAAAAASVWDFDAETTVNAFGMAYSQAAGNQQCLLDGALAVRVQQGLSASAGLLAAMMAKRGITGPTSSLEGKFGYYPVYCAGDYDRDQVLKELGSRYTVGDVSIKPYPCCKFTHTAIAAAMKAREDPRFDASRIESVLIHVDNQEYFNVVCDPVAEKRVPTSSVEAQFSMPYTVSVALLNGAVKLADFTPGAIAEPQRLALAQRVTPSLGQPQYTTRMLPTPSRIEITLTDGTVIEQSSEVAPGHPRDPLSWDQLAVKVREMATWPEHRMPEEKLSGLIEICRRLESVSDVRSLVADHLSW